MHYTKEQIEESTLPSVGEVNSSRVDKYVEEAMVLVMKV